MINELPNTLPSLADTTPTASFEYTPFVPLSARCVDIFRLVGGQLACVRVISAALVHAFTEAKLWHFKKI